MNEVRGTGALLRLALRLDRVRLPIWVGVLTLVVVATAVGFAGLYPDVASRQQFAGGIGANPALRALYGPLDAPEQIGGLTVWRQGAIQLVLVGLMGLTTMVRHTRADEEAGRLELLGAGVVGRRAPLLAAFLTAGLGGLGVGIGVAGGLVAVGEDAAGSVAFGASLTATALVLAGVAAVTAQVADSARAASGMAGAALAVAFVLRAAGDAAVGGGLSWLSWLSPLGWAQGVRPYADERWWLLLVLVLAAGVLVVTASALRDRRDLGNGLVAVRPGPSHATPGLASVEALAWRLQGTTLRWWGLGMLVAGLVFGGVVDAITQMFEDTPMLAEILERIGGSGRVVDGFLAAILSVFAVLASAHAVGAVLRLRTEETTDRAEPVLATAVSRRRWASSHLLVATLGPAVLLAIAGGAAGLASGLVTDRGIGTTGRVAVAALAHLPAVWVLVGIAVLLVGVRPSWSAAAYGALAAFLLLGQVGEALQLPQSVLNLSPFVHVPALPGAAMAWAPLAWLTAVAGALLAAGLLGLQRRDVPR